MSLDQELRAVLADRADRCRAPIPDLAALWAGGLRLRRRRRVVGAVTMCIVLGTIAAGVAVGLAQRDTRGALDPVDRPALRWAESTHVPWCVTDPDDPDQELIVGAGAPVRAKPWCRWSGPGQDFHLWYHGGSTVLTTPRDGVYRVADGRLTPMSTEGGGKPAISHDGRYAAWQTPYGWHCGAVSMLEVYDVTRTEEVATTRIPGISCSQVQGIDDRGRVYVTVGEAKLGNFAIQMYDTKSDSWTKVVGLPAGADNVSITYVTADGFAVETSRQVFDGNPLPMASGEGVVQADGHFVGKREVPVGRGLWSPDRSRVLVQRPEGMVVQPADDLTTQLGLNLPIDEFRATPTHLPMVNLLWESSSSVLVNADGPQGGPAYRCDVDTGDCTVVDHPGQPALGLSTLPGG